MTSKNSVNLSKDTIRLLDRLTLNTSIHSNHLLIGRHTSRKLGSSPNFKEYRKYKSGEDIKNIDWRVSGKSQNLLVRKHEHQALVEHWLILDGSGSMEFPVDQFNKYHFQMLMSRVFLYLLNNQSDPVGIILETHDRSNAFKPSTTSTDHLNAIQHLMNHQPSKSFDLPSRLSKFQQQLKKNSIIWIMTDFDCNSEPFIPILKNLNKEGHDVRVLHLYHPNEKNFSWKGECEFNNIEDTNQFEKIRPELLKQKYLKLYLNHQNYIQKIMKEIGIPYFYIDITLPIEKHIIQIFEPI